MCGRYTRKHTGVQVKASLASQNIEFTETGNHILIEMLGHKNYNCLPGAVLPVISYNVKEKGLDTRMLTWGLKTRHDTVCINAVAERMRESPTWSKWMTVGKRVLVPATSFIEWSDHRTSHGRKIPVEFYYSNAKEVMFFAGISDTKEGFVIVTQPAGNILVKKVHERMPLILREGNISHWLMQDPLEPLYPDDVILKMRTISTDVSWSKETDNKEILKPIDYGVSL